MSSISIYNANMIAGRRIKPSINFSKRKFSLKQISTESPSCVTLCEKLGIDFEELLIFENYNYLINENKRQKNLKEKFENHDYLKNKKLFLLNQAANRIENNLLKKDYYSNLSQDEFFKEKKIILGEFKNLKLKLNV